MKSMSRIITIGIVVVVTGLTIWGWLAISPGTPGGDEGPWGGVDVSVIQKFAADAGREAREPFINTDQGDLLLFVFALGGAVGGFVGGYYWRRLVAERDTGKAS